jgi:hypothetical protein
LVGLTVGAWVTPIVSGDLVGLFVGFVGARVGSAVVGSSVGSAVVGARVGFLVGRLEHTGHARSIMWFASQ